MRDMRVRLYLKILALTVTLAGIGAIVFDHSNGAQIPLLVGLFMLLVISNPVEDERSVQIKASSLYTAFILCYGLKLLTRNLHNHGLISFAFVEIDHFLIAVLALANGIFYGRLYILRF